MYRLHVLRMLYYVVRSSLEMVYVPLSLWSWWALDIMLCIIAMPSYHHSIALNRIIAPFSGGSRNFKTRGSRSWRGRIWVWGLFWCPYTPTLCFCSESKDNAICNLHLTIIIAPLLLHYNNPNLNSAIVW